MAQVLSKIEGEGRILKMSISSEAVAYVPSTLSEDPSPSITVTRRATILTLPAEVRQMIWKYSIGHNLEIHILTSMYELIHNVCRATVNENEAAELFRSAKYAAKFSSSKVKPDQRIFLEQHRNCYKATCEKLNPTAILTTCRQIYDEANPILWGSNTWSFSNVDAMRYFLECRTPFQQKHLKRLHIAPCQAFPQFSHSLVAKFPNIEVIHIDEYVRGPRQTLEYKKGLALLQAARMTLICTMYSGEHYTPEKWREFKRRADVNLARIKHYQQVSKDESETVTIIDDAETSTSGVRKRPVMYATC